MIGRTLGHYRVVKKLGAGGMGEIYLAHDEHLQRDVAIKVLPPGTLIDESARRRFRKEAFALSRLSHPNIETVFDFDTQDGIDFLVMEYIPGLTLQDMLSTGPMPEKEIARLGMQMAEGLAAAHEPGIVHRDLKPANLIITPDGRLKILDFGLAKLLRPVSETATTRSVSEMDGVAGTLPYMAPEQLRGEPVDARTDIHAAGAILYQMASGRRPFCADTAAKLTDAILHQAPVMPRAWNPNLSPRLEQIIFRCMEKEPELRYQSAKDLLIDLRRLGAPAPRVVGPRPRFLVWRRALLAVVGALAVILAVAVGLNIAGLRERLFGGIGALRVESLAVLPLANLSGDPEQEYFADGMTEALITDLSKIGALRVISRTSVMQYKGVKKSLPEIARALNVDAVVEGSVLRAGNRVRITAQLIAIGPERHLWANSYDRELRDVLAVHSEVAQAIAGEIRIAVSPEEKVRLGSVRRVNPEAYDDYLRGRDQQARWSGGGYKKAIEYFQSSIKKDATFAPAYAALSDSYATFAYWGYVPPQLAYPMAKAAALRAVELDDASVQAHSALGNIHWFYDWDVAAAEREMKRALALDSSWPGSHLRYAAFLATVRDNRQEAIAELRRVQELDPASVLISGRVMTAWVFFFVHEYDKAMRQAQDVLAMDPKYLQAYYILGQVAVGQSRPADAVAPLEKALTLSRDSTSLGYLASAYALSGQQAKARTLLNEMRETAKQEYVPPMRFAWVCASTGDVDSALKYLEKSYEERDAMLWWLKIIPEFEPIRSDRRFQDLIRRMNFPR